MGSMIPHPASGGFVSAFIDNPLILPGKDIVTAPVTIASGQQLKAGSVLGCTKIGTLSAEAEADEGNTGNGEIELAEEPIGAGAKPGVYKAICIEAASDEGTFVLEDPDGVTVGTAAVGVDYDGPLKFKIKDGATDFVAGDKFFITVTSEGHGKYVLAKAAATDGSADAIAVLGEDLDTTGGDKVFPVIVEGYLNEDALVLGEGHSADTVRLSLRQNGIHIRKMSYSG